MLPLARRIAGTARSSRHLHAGRNHAAGPARGRRRRRAKRHDLCGGFRRRRRRGRPAARLAICASVGGDGPGRTSARTAWASPAADRGSATIPDETLQELGPSPVAVISQSGALCASINRAINDLGLKVGYLISCGNQIGRSSRRFHRLLRRRRRAAGPALLYRGRTRCRKLPRCGAARARQRQDRRRGQDRRLGRSARFGAGAYRLARRARGGIRRIRGGGRDRPARLARRTRSRRSNSWRARRCRAAAISRR